MRFIAQMLGKFSAQHSFHQPNLEFLHPALVAEQILRPFNAAKQLVQ